VISVGNAIRQVAAQGGLERLTDEQKAFHLVWREGKVQISTSQTGGQITDETKKQLAHACEAIARWCAPVWTHGKLQMNVNAQGFFELTLFRDGHGVVNREYGQGSAERGEAAIQIAATFLDSGETFFSTVGYLNVTYTNDRNVAMVNVEGRLVPASEVIDSSEFPIVFREALIYSSQEGKKDGWPCTSWNPSWLKDSPYADIRTNVRFHRYPATTTTAIPWEPNCKHASITVKTFCEWLELQRGFDPKARSHCRTRIPVSRKRDRALYEEPTSTSTRSSKEPEGPLNTVSQLVCRFPPEAWWGYMDYKHFETFFDSQQRVHAAKATRFEAFGVKRKAAAGGENSTNSLPALWIGSAGSATRLHYDVFGYNLVAQISGVKRWKLFSPEQKKLLHATRIPFEESSVYSDYDLRNDAPSAAFCDVQLNPGSLLYVPRHWWHEVQSLKTSVSVNQWCEVKADSEERIGESAVKSLVNLWILPQQEAALRKRQEQSGQPKNVTVQEDGNIISAWEHTYGRHVNWLNSNECPELMGSTLRSTLLATIMHMEEQGCISESQANMLVRLRSEKISYLLARAVTHPESVKVISKHFLQQVKRIGNKSKGTENTAELEKTQFQLLPIQFNEFHFLDLNEAQYLYQEIFVRRVYDVAVLGFKNCADENLNIVDVGANIGLFALFCKKRWPRSRILCVEPIPEIFRVLQHNLQSFEKDILCVKAGVSDSEGLRDFHYFPDMPGESTMHPDERFRQQAIFRSKVSSDITRMKAEGKTTGQLSTTKAEMLEALKDIEQQAHSQSKNKGLERRCPTHRLSTLLKRIGTQSQFQPFTKRIDLLKIDAEGEELGVLKSIDNDDWKRLQRVCVEVVNVDNRLGEICNILVKRGFRVFTSQAETSTEGGYLSYVPKELQMFIVYALRYD